MSERLTRDEAEAWVRDFRMNRADLTDTNLLRVAWVLAADKPNHPLVQWARFQGESRARGLGREER